MSDATDQGNQFDPPGTSRADVACSAPGGWTVSARAPGAHRDVLDADTHYLAVALDGTVCAFEIDAGGRVAESPAPAETYAFLPAGAPRTVRAERTGRTVQLRLTRAFVAANPEFGALDRIRSPRLHMFDTELVSVAAVLCRALRAPGAEAVPERIEPLVRTLLVRLAQCLTGPEPLDLGRQTSVQAAIAYIDANLADALTLEEIAAHVGTSQYHFARHFREVMGTSIHRFVVLRRCARAEHLLERTSEPIAQIAYGVGFGSQSHMTTVMRRHLGRTPGEIRKAAPPLGA